MLTNEDIAIIIAEIKYIPEKQLEEYLLDNIDDSSILIEY